MALSIASLDPALAQDGTGVPSPNAPQTAPSATSTPDRAPSNANTLGAPAPPGTVPAEAAPLERILEPTLPHELTPWGMFMAADLIVKTVMVGLAFASVLSWTIWLAKSLELVGAKRRARSAILLLARVRSLREGSEKLARSRGVVAGFVRAAVGELGLSADVLDRDGVKERVASRLDRIELAAGRRMARGTGILATIGATAPFVGLFGTVWGIMNSFIGISKAQTTNLAVVAPGIAEALLATAIGLVAAIPAVIIFNVFARAIAGYRLQLGDGAAEVMRLVSRDLDRAHGRTEGAQRAWAAE
jgi:biopolymer transport protein ExbB